MSATAEPPDDPFQDIVAGLDINSGEIAANVVDVSALENEVLLKLYHDLTNELQERREVIAPKTDRGREAHSQRGAARVELAERGILPMGE